MWVVRSKPLLARADIGAQGVVYDMTQFLMMHPGGHEVILAAAGQDVR